MKVSYVHEVPMGHRLQKHDGKCRFLHGHNYVVTVSVYGVVDPVTGFVIDFSVLKKAVRKALEPFDHAFVLEIGDPAGKDIAGWSVLIPIPIPPTAENLAVLWKTQVAAELGRSVADLSIEVRETRDCYVAL